MSDRGSESESPLIPSPIPKQHRPMSNRDWWPNQLALSNSAPAFARVQSDE